LPDTRSGFCVWWEFKTWIWKPVKFKVKMKDRLTAPGAVKRSLFYPRRHVVGENKISIGMIPRRPISMENASTILENGENAA